MLWPTRICVLSSCCQFDTSWRNRSLIVCDYFVSFGQVTTQTPVCVCAHACYLPHSVTFCNYCTAYCHHHRHGFGTMKPCQECKTCKVSALLHTQLFVCNLTLSFSLPVMVLYWMCDWIVSVTCDEMIVVNELLSWLFQHHPWSVIAAPARSLDVEKSSTSGYRGGTLVQTLEHMEERTSAWKSLRGLAVSIHLVNVLFMWAETLWNPRIEAGPTYWYWLKLVLKYRPSLQYIPVTICMWLMCVRNRMLSLFCQILVWVF